MTERRSVLRAETLVLITAVVTLHFVACRAV
ncbi:hypothetical protein FB465_2171 [Kitasatospora atroaurantiaca]|uniref:Uncharacterized protein n=1 Tax=Kitasatospora atroaurantiaca TaxID=285545 RepID=A0A561ENH6_9ACTN|nr:hypothetical protein FB465_2171 [Kitasatospora atroaurantiaca]